MDYQLMQFDRLFYKLPIVFKIRLSSNEEVILDKRKDNFKKYGNLKVRSITSDKGYTIYTLY